VHSTTSTSPRPSPATSRLGPRALSSHEIAAIGRFVRSLDDGVGRLGRTFGRTWRPLVAPDYRRRLGRAFAQL